MLFPNCNPAGSSIDFETEIDASRNYKVDEPRIHFPTRKMAFLRSAIAATSALLPVANHSLFSQPNSNTQNPSLLSLSSSSSSSSARFGLVTRPSQPLSAVTMDAPTSDRNQPISQVPIINFGKWRLARSSCNVLFLCWTKTEFMVDMSCEGCVKSVKTKLQVVKGVKNVEVDLGNQVVRVLGSSSVKEMTEALKQTGRNARLIGQGVPEDFLVSAAVAEFKGPDIFGVVRFAQLNMELARIEANFSGLSPGKHGWSINEFGDLTKGAASTGKVFNPTTENEPVGDLRTLEVDEKGEAFFSGVKEKLRVVDLIGRAVAVYETEDRSDAGLTAAVIARSAGVGENYKKLCTCDGTTIWESSDRDFVTSKV
ncbi:Copper chaperone for superoxide dismutase, chloroplastic/cytosolic [Linum grandiflorum]